MTIAPVDATEDLAILNLQPYDSVVSRASNALKKVRGDVVIRARPNLKMLKNGETLTIVAHGSPTDIAGMSAPDIVNLLRRLKISPARIELCSCDTGLGELAQEIADLMVVEVTAPLGRVSVVDDIYGMIQVKDRVTRKLRSPGELMKTFKPRTSVNLPGE